MKRTLLCLLLPACGGVVAPRDASSEHSNTAVSEASVEAQAPEDVLEPMDSELPPEDVVVGPEVVDARLDSGNPAFGVCPEDTRTHFALCGRVTFDHVPARDNVREGGVRLDYSAMQARPVRRARLFAMRGGMGVAEGVTYDDGSFALMVPKTAGAVTVRVMASSIQRAYRPEGIGQEQCNGASWEVSVADNTARNAIYALEPSMEYTARNTTLQMHASLQWETRYVQRQAAPFALLDTVINAMETVCKANPAQMFPTLSVRWSPNNTNTSGDSTRGQIGTSHYRSRESALYLLGAENVDTDEYDDHVVVHEYGHYLEDKLYRSDGLGGDHEHAAMLDPSVAFAEGYATAFSGMVFNDPVYVDTNGMGQRAGFTISAHVLPEADNRGTYSERSVQYFLWRLYEDRDAAPNSGDYSRIHELLVGDQRTTPALTSALTFAAYYNARYGGSAENLRMHWEMGLSSPYDALCEGRCTGTGDTADPFDSDDELASAYGASGSSPRKYPREMGMMYPTEFWQHSRLLRSGTNAATPHEQTRLGGYRYYYNRWGSVRNFRFLGTGSMTTVSVRTTDSAGCARDDLDLRVFRSGTIVQWDEQATGCPSVQLPTTRGAMYMVRVMAPAGAREVPLFSVSVSPKPHAPDGTRAPTLEMVSPMIFLGTVETASDGTLYEVMRPQRGMNQRIL